jgi:aspartate/methionine/tyrosine aminotransferase
VAHWLGCRKKEYIDAVLKVKSNMDSGMFLGLQHAAVEALKNGKRMVHIPEQCLFRKKKSSS